MRSLSQLISTIPEWVEALKVSANQIDILAMPITPSGAKGRRYTLKITQDQTGSISIFENSDSDHLPKFCLERHINADGSFCVFLNSSAPIVNDDEATKWWLSLQRYLNCQDYAHRTKLWPVDSGLSHGEAAYQQIAIEKLTEPLGWGSEVKRGMFRGEGWLAKNLPRLTKDRQMPVTKRSPCPRGCTKNHRVGGRKDCYRNNCRPDCVKSHTPVVRADCKNREDLEEIFMLEHKRREIEKKYVKALVQDGLICCGTMKNCPLDK